MAWWGRSVLQTVWYRSFLLGSLGLAGLVWFVGLVPFVVALRLVFVQLIQVELTQEIFEHRQPLCADISHWCGGLGRLWSFAGFPSAFSHIALRRDAGI